MATRSRRREGFIGQHLVVLPGSVVAEMAASPAIRGLFPIAAGYFPRAPGHFVERAEGLEEFLFVACLSGKGWVELGGTRWTLAAGEAAGIPAGLPHRYGADAADPWSIMWAHCQGTELPSYTALLQVTGSSPVMRFPPGVFDRLGFAGVYEALERGFTPVNLLRASARLRLVFAELVHERLPANARSRPAAESLQQSLDWMQVHFPEAVNLASLARRAGLSVPHYSALFRQKTGSSPLAYFQRLKIQRACQLLATSPAAVAEVAAEVGFDDPYHFSRVFTKVMGHSPREFRKSKKG